MKSHRVVVSIPEQFRDPSDPSDDGRRFLLKALYGLPVSPKLWASQISDDLKKLGWEESQTEPGLWRLIESERVVASLALYVDDCSIMAESDEMADKLVDQIKQLHPLSMIKCDFPEENNKHRVSFDLLGSDCVYDCQQRYLKISMTSYIKKMLAKFDMSQDDLKTVTNPDFEESSLYDEKSPETDFNYRGLVGSLQWCVSVSRPDIAHATNTLSRACARKPTRAMASAGRKVLRYLAGTLNVGLEYSPDIESKFYSSLSQIADHPENNNMDKNLLQDPISTYGDASFGSCYRTLRSITGIVIYCYGCPIHWVSRPQTIFTSSTMESEWVACSSAIELATGPNLLIKFLTGLKNTADHKDEGPVFCDNRTAVISSRKDSQELTRSSRHIALRHQRVKDNAKRIFFTPTTIQRADGVTKSSNTAALKLIFEAETTLKLPNVKANLAFEYCMFTKI